MRLLSGGGAGCADASEDHLGFLDDAHVGAGGEAGAGADEALHVEDPVAGAAHEMVMPLPTGFVLLSVSERPFSALEFAH